MFEQLDIIKGISVADTDLWADVIRADMTDPPTGPVKSLTEKQGDALNNWIFYQGLNQLNIDDEEFMQLLNFTNVRSYVEMSGYSVLALQSL